MKELAFLFKLGGGASSAPGSGNATPAATGAGGQRSADVSPAAAAAAAAAQDAGLASIKQRLQQFQDSAAIPGQAAQRGNGQAAEPAAQQEQQHLAAAPAAAAALPSQRAAVATKTAPKTAAATSRLPVPPARASRLRPPTSSSGYFTNAATTDSKCVSGRPGLADGAPCLNACWGARALCSSCLLTGGCSGAA